MKTLRTVIMRMVEKATMGCSVDSIKRKPGYYIESLSKEDRELLKTATTKDFNGRWW